MSYSVNSTLTYQLTRYLQKTTFTSLVTLYSHAENPKHFVQILDQQTNTNNYILNSCDIDSLLVKILIHNIISTGSI
jgi:hypothetical protein